MRYERRATGDNRGAAPGPLLERLVETAEAALAARRRMDGLRPAGLSVAVPGLVEQATGTVVFAPNLGWHGVPVAEELETRLGLSVRVENESNLAALAEHWTGAAVGIDDFVCVFGEVGVGGGSCSAAALPRHARLRRRVRARLRSTRRPPLRVRQPRLRGDARRPGGDRRRRGHPALGSEPRA